MVETEQTLCVVLDCMPDPVQRKQKLVLRPTSKVADLFDDIKRLYGYESFVLRLQPGNFEPAILNTYRDQTVKEAGIQFDKTVTNIISILPLADFTGMETSGGGGDLPMITDEGHQNSSSFGQPMMGGKAAKKTANIVSSDEVSSDDDLALGASASPTESSGAIPVPPAPPALPPAFSYMDTASSSKTTFRRINSNERSSHFVGLVNQAMTCYLNSLLQALFMTPEFRNALYNWEFDGSGETKSIPYQLQKLFLNLQTSTKMAVETTDLTKSFGWDSTEAWQQHDIQELCRVMFDALEHKFKNTKEADLISRLYEGKMIDYVKCLDCGTEKSREDTFLDIPLPVRPFGSVNAYGSVEEALRAFVQPETLDGNNQYHCDKCNKKCDAHKGLKFSKFPYILTLHLKRFDFDYQTLHRIKLNDKVTFPQTLNLNGFTNQEPTTPNGPLASDAVSIGESVESAVKCDDCSTTDSGSALEEDSLSATNFQPTPTGAAEQDLQEDDEGIDMNTDVKSVSSSNDSGPYVYELFAIMIHSGSASGGHYYAYIKDFESSNWYSFNDQTVSTITQEDIQKSFGGGSGGAYKPYYSSAYSSSTNAYMLMYRQTDSVRNCKFIKEDLFPEHIKTLKDTLKDSDRYIREYTGAGSGSDLVTKIRVFFYSPQFQRMTDTKVYISSDSTLEETVEEAHRKLARNAGELNQFRLVAYDSSSEMIERSFEGREQEAISTIMNSLKNSNELMLEMRNEGEDFQQYQPGGINTKVFQVDLETNDIDGPVQIRGLMSGTVRDYKQVIARKLRLKADNLIVVKIGASGDQNSGAEYSCSIATVLSNDSVTLQDEQLHLSHKIFVAQASVINDDVQSNVKKIVERYEHVITLYIVLPATDQDALNQMSIPPYEPDATPLIVETEDCPKTPTTPTSHDCVDAVGYIRTTVPEVQAGGEYRRISPLPPLETTECNSEDSSLSDSDRTLVDVAQDESLSHISSTSHSPACSDPGQLSSPDDSHRGAISDCDPDNDVEMASVPSLSPPMKTRFYYFRATPYFEANSSTDGEPQNMLKVLVDRSMNIATLKRHLEPFLRVSHQYFKIFYASKCTTNQKSTECTRLNDTLSIFKDGERLVIELGRALRKNEFKCKLFFLNLKEIDDESDKLPFLCEWILNVGSTVEQTFPEILAHVRKINPRYANLVKENCVLRKKTYKSPSSVLFDEQIFGNDIYLCGSEIQLVLQELTEDSPRMTDSDDMLFFARRWNPSTRTLGDFQEFILKKEGGELVQELSRLSGIPEDNLEYTKLTSSFPRCSVSTGSIPNLVWSAKRLPSSETWTTFNDGTLFFYKDNTEPLKELTTEERQEMNNKQVSEISSTSRATTYSPKRERGLRIYVDSSPRKNDE